MPNAVQLVSTFFTAVGAGTSIVSPSPGDIVTVPSFSNPSGRLEQIWASGATVDFIRVRSPRLHDANQGLRIWIGGNPRRRLLPWGMDETLYSSDTPIVEIDATGAGSNGLCMQYAFDDLPGVQPRLASWAEVQPRILHVMGCEVDVTSGAIGAYGASAALNSVFDNFEAGADYALLGYTLSVACLAIAVTGKDTGNLKIGGPGDTDAFQTSDYFIRQSNESGRARIPIIAANNRASTILQNVDIAAATATKVTLLLAQLQ
jgi:hypothetical protein